MERGAGILDQQRRQQRWEAFGQQRPALRGWPPQRKPLLLHSQEETVNEKEMDRACNQALIDGMVDEAFVFRRSIYAYAIFAYGLKIPPPAKRWRVIDSSTYKGCFPFRFYQ